MAAWSMRFAAVLVAFGTIAGCRQILGIEEATLICPPEMPNCKFCDDASDCGRATECHSWSCNNNLCVAVNAAVRTKCSTGVCSDDSTSECVACVVYEDCPAGQCRDHICSRCDDGIKNGWEADVDCGGAPCKACLGFPCVNPSECKSGFCADGTCCDNACDAICSFCGFPYEGRCSSIPKYMHDTSPVVCSGENMCDGFGSCLLRPGEICASAVECVSYRCEQSRCRKLAGEDCSFPQECANDSCVGGKCQD